MGYLDDEVKRLHTVIEQLEGRVKSLETRHLGGAPVSTEEIRMILIGPPGAGKFVAAAENALNSSADVWPSDEADQSRLLR